MIERRKTGIDSIGDVPWGTHLCQFYNNKKDLIDILVPYFKTGLENNEFCLCVTSKPLTEKEAKKTIKRAVPDLDQYLKRGQIEIVPHTEWYLKDGAFNLQRALNAWFNKLNQALAKGYDGMRVTGNMYWLERRGWKDFDRYEEELNNAIGKYRMIALCTYPLDKHEVHEVIDIVRNHQFALIKREGKWGFVESTERKRADKVLRETRDYLENLFNYANVPIIVWDPSFRITRFNHAFEHLTGYMAEEVTGKELKMFFPEVSREDSIEKIKRTSSGEYWEAVEIPILCKDGDVRIALWNSANIYTEDSLTIIATIAQGIDITERKRAEEMLQHQRDALTTHTRILSAILRTRDLDKLLNTILEEVMFFLHVEFGCIHLVQG
ncbi:MAG: PAS domain S-box protein, partial [Nitrospira sp.]|nr:PAS domain S-box protein [Nitrospira sp.]